MTRLEDIPTGDSITMLAYGPAGSGKTWFCGTAGDRTLYCNVEERLATLQSEGFKKRFKFNPYVISVTEEPIPDGGAKALDYLTVQINEHIEKHANDFDVIIVDGATALRRFAMNKALELNQKIGKSKTLGKLQALSTEVEFVDVTVQDFGAEMNLVEKFIMKMKEYCFDTHKHFIMTAHERIQYNKAANVGDVPTVHSVKPGFTGQTFPDSTPGLFDLVWHFEVVGAGEQRKYRARTEGDAALVAKSCWNGLFPTIVDNPNWLQIVKTIKGK